MNFKFFYKKVNGKASAICKYIIVSFTENYQELDFQRLFNELA